VRPRTEKLVEACRGSKPGIAWKTKGAASASAAGRSASRTATAMFGALAMSKVS
jgi:hypothetical protein